MMKTTERSQQTTSRRWNTVSLAAVGQRRYAAQTCESPRRLFLSYAHEDERWREQLQVNLDILHWRGLVTVWFDQRIVPGDDWDGAIRRKLKEADIIVFLVSRYLLASEYIQTVELEIAMKRHRTRQARVVPVILRTCSWQETPLRALQALPKAGRPVNTWHDKESAFADVEVGIRRAVEEMRRLRRD